MMAITEPVLHYLQRIHQTVSEQADDLQPAMDRIMANSTVGSPTDIDYKAISRSTRSEDRQKLWSQVQFNCLHTTVNVADHVRAVALLLSQPSVGVPIYAHSTLARVAIESAANVAYVLDRSAAFDLRFARGIALLITNSDAARRTANEVPGTAYMSPPGPAMTREHQALLDLIRRARIDIVAGRNGEPKGVRVTPGAPEAPVNIKTAVLVRDLYPDLPAIYNLFSGVTHGMPHKLADNARVANRRAHWDADPLDVGGAALAVINAAHTVLAAHAWHRGLEDDPAIEASRVRIHTVDAAMQRFGREHVRLPRPGTGL